MLQFVAINLQKDGTGFGDKVGLTNHARTNTHCQ